MTYDIAVFGSAFDPCHAGHMDAMAQALVSATTVLAVPAFAHAFGKAMAPFDVRCAIVAASLQQSALPADRVKLCTVEQRIHAQKTGPVFTYHLLQAIAHRHPSARVAFVIGPDNAEPDTWQSFYRANDILARWGIIHTKQRIDVRSTGLRQRLHQDAAIEPALLCTQAQAIIRQHHLYRDKHHAA